MTRARGIGLTLVLLVTGACSSGPGGSASDLDAGGGEEGSADASSMAACAGRAAQPLDATWTVTVGSTSRTAKVHVPASYDPTHATPVVINMHGLWSNPGEQASRTHMLAKSDSAGFIAIHPAGTGDSWNAGACCNPAANDDVDDVAFIDALLDKAAAELCVDEDRVYATGFSNGGFMSHRLACELTDRFAAIASVSGVMGIGTCSPSRPIPVLQIHGTSDGVVPWNGGGWGTNYKSVESTIDGWTQRNGCSGTAQTMYDQGDATCVKHGGCTAGADVELCTIDGGGHQWPGGESSGAFNGKVSTDLDATDTLWTFFAAHPRH